MHIFFTKRDFIECMSWGTRFRLTAPSDVTYILDTCQFLVSVFILANRRDVLLQIVVFFHMLTDMLLVFKAHAITQKYINTQIPQRKDQCSLYVTKSRKHKVASRKERQIDQLRNCYLWS